MKLSHKSNNSRNLIDQSSNILARAAVDTQGGRKEGGEKNGRKCLV